MIDSSTTPLSGGEAREVDLKNLNLQPRRAIYTADMQKNGKRKHYSAHLNHNNSHPETKANR